MCWYSKHCTELVAEKDIICYKFVSRYDVVTKRKYKIFGPKLTTVISPIMEYKYTLGKENPRQRIIPIHMYNIIYTIREGYHSFDTIRNRDIIGAVWIQCIIPKGTVYYKNDRGELVSENIILTKIVQT